MITDVYFNLETFVINEGNCTSDIAGLKIFERVLDNNELNVEVNSFVFEDID